MTDKGRPSEYNSEYHPQKLLELMSAGYLNEEIASEFNISLSTLKRWRKIHPEFQEAYEVGEPKSEVAAVIRPLKDMIATGNEKGYKALAHLARNKYGHDKTGPQSVTNIQNNIGAITVNNKEDYERISAEIKDIIVDLNIVDAEILKIEKNNEE